MKDYNATCLSDKSQVSTNSNFQFPSVYEQDLIESKEYDLTIRKLRQFFESKRFIEVHTQSRLSILAACEDPTTVQTYQYLGQTWPLPQTGQMWLEYELLTKPDVPGYFCISTSYRHERNPVPGRHKVIFPMFEFETHGNLDTLKALELELLDYLGISAPETTPICAYESLSAKYGVEDLTAEEETRMWHDFGSALLLTHFPMHTSPFWNMKINEHNPNLANKIDVIICGQETIGSAERSSNPDEMHHLFHHISNGGYAQLLYDLFGRERVEQELDAFLAIPFFPRVGGGIGVTRMMRALKLLNLLDEPKIDAIRQAI